MDNLSYIEKKKWKFRFLGFAGLVGIGFIIWLWAQDWAASAMYGR
jgi:hypothetical protein